MADHFNSKGESTVQIFEVRKVNDILIVSVY